MISFNAIPLTKYSSQHRVSLLSLLGIKTSISPGLTLAFNFNLQIPFEKIPSASLIFNLRDESANRPDTTDFYINNLTRWRLCIAQCASFEDYLKTLKSNHMRNYRQVQKVFNEYGATLSFIDGDWSEHADKVYQLYHNVATRHGSQLYDLNYFRRIAKVNEYKLICAWHGDSLVSVLIIFDEVPVYHSMLVGFDYEHSKNIYAYSLLHYELIRIAITAKKYSVIDAGITGDKAKSMMNFKPVTSCMDVQSKNILIKSILRTISWFAAAAINNQGKLTFKLRYNEDSPRPLSA